MNPISPPSSSINNFVIPIDNTKLVNSILLQLTAFIHISFNSISDSSFNGNIRFQYQDKNGTWHDIATLISGSSVHTSNFQQSPTNTDIIYPYAYRIIVHTAATLGTATITVDYL